MLEESMLSFELSAIDLILAIAVIVLLILYATKSSPKMMFNEMRAQKEKRAPKRAVQECPYLFGYLRDLGNAAPIPNECLGCPRRFECEGETNILQSTTELLADAPLTQPTEDETALPKTEPTQQRTVSIECPFRFGYLETLSRDIPIPEECGACSRILECLGETTSTPRVVKVSSDIPKIHPIEDTLPLPKTEPTQQRTVSIECPFRFGYLETLSRDAPIPEECQNCPRILDCSGDPTSMSNITKVYARLVSH